MAGRKRRIAAAASAERNSEVEREEQKKLNIFENRMGIETDPENASENPWAVMNEKGKILRSGFIAQEDAQDWIDSDEGVEEISRNKGTFSPRQIEPIDDDVEVKEEE